MFPEISAFLIRTLANILFTAYSQSYFTVLLPLSLVLVMKVLVFSARRSVERRSGLGVKIVQKTELRVEIVAHPSEGLQLSSHFFLSLAC